MEAERFPVDYDALKKGDVIPAERVQRLTGLPKGHEKYSLRALQWGRKIEKEMEQRGCPVIIVYEKYALKVLTDSEAIVYNAKSFREGIAKSQRAHRRNRTRVDRCELTAAEKASHETEVRVSAAILRGIRNTRKEAHKLLGGEGRDPKMLEPPEDEKPAGGD